MDIFDILLIFLIAVIIIWATTYNINTSINSKLSNISINIPPITIPQSQIVVKIQKPNTLNNTYDVFVEKPENVGYSQTVSLNPTDNKIENFASNSINQLKNVSSEVTLMQENKEEPTKENKEEQIQEEEPGKRICNKSIYEQKLDAYGNMFYNSRNIKNPTYPICDDVTYIDPINDSRVDIDVVNEYKNKQQYVKTYLEDPIIRGYNVNDYDHSIKMNGLGKINLENGEKKPKPMGFIFETSPAYNV